MILQNNRDTNVILSQKSQKKKKKRKAKYLWQPHPSQTVWAFDTPKQEDLPFRAIGIRIILKHIFSVQKISFKF